MLLGWEVGLNLLRRKRLMGTMLRLGELVEERDRGKRRP
jgi:hypothetical protein